LSTLSKDRSRTVEQTIDSVKLAHLSQTG